MLSLIMDEIPERVTQRAPIIELTVTPVDPFIVVGLLDRLGLREQLGEFTWEQHPNWIVVSNQQTILSLNKVSGGLRYRIRPLADEPGTDLKASVSHLEKIARSFLDQLGRPSGPLKLERVTYLHTETGTVDGGVWTRSTLDAGLIFTRTVEDLPVIGPGGMAMVKIGTDESVVGGREIWRPILRRGAKLPLRTPEEATELLHKRLKKRGINGVLHVRKAQLGYAELGIEEKQQYLEPCYAYVVESTGEFVDFKKIEIIPAAKIGPLASAFER
jgi:hypothetical protein